MDMASKEKPMKGIEYFLIATQNNIIMTNYIKGKFYNIKIVIGPILDTKRSEN